MSSDSIVSAPAREDAITYTIIFDLHIVVPESNDDREGDTAGYGDPLLLLVVRLCGCGGRVRLAPQVLLQHIVRHRKQPLRGHLCRHLAKYSKEAPTQQPEAIKGAGDWSTGSKMINTKLFTKAQRMNQCVPEVFMQ